MELQKSAGSTPCKVDSTGFLRWVLYRQVCCYRWQAVFYDWFKTPVHWLKLGRWVSQGEAGLPALTSSRRRS